MDPIQKGEFELAKSMLADDFQFSGSVPEPLNKDAWLEMSINLKSAFPNLNYHCKMIGTDGDRCEIHHTNKRHTDGDTQPCEHEHGFNARHKTNLFPQKQQKRG
ncbi:MAG: hypothetical protein IPJ47_15070 [Anaerolineales bacterium]|nr:hypothetical protein [Anaerolineales bacterium]